MIELKGPMPIYPNPKKSQAPMTKDWGQSKFTGGTPVDIEV